MMVIWLTLVLELSAAELEATPSASEATPSASEESQPEPPDDPAAEPVELPVTSVT